METLAKTGATRRALLVDLLRRHRAVLLTAFAGVATPVIAYRLVKLLSSYLMRRVSLTIELLQLSSLQPQQMTATMHCTMSGVPTWLICMCVIRK